MKVSLLTGGGDKPYVLGLVEALVLAGVTVDVVGSDNLDVSQVAANPCVKFFNLRGNQDPSASAKAKVSRIVKYYCRLLSYSAKTDARVFHILWANRFVVLDRVAMIWYYKLLGKRLVFTAHNVNERERDGGDNAFNRWTLRLLYGTVDRIIVHTVKMKQQLIAQFEIPEEKIAIIPFGINNTLPVSELTNLDAKTKLGLTRHHKVLLFFGRIAQYKGLEYLIQALKLLANNDDSYRLVIAGSVKNCRLYWNEITELIRRLNLEKHVIIRKQFIPDEDVEVYFKAADVSVLPYRFIYQSGVLFLSYSFGLPIIATDVGSLAEDIVEGQTGMICKPEDAEALTATIGRYMESELFVNLNESREMIKRYGNERFSWEKAGIKTRAVYQAMAVDDAGGNGYRLRG